MGPNGTESYKSFTVETQYLCSSLLIALSAYYSGFKPQDTAQVPLTALKRSSALPL